MLVVTGASGFLGRTIVRRALDRGFAVAAVSRRPLAMHGVRQIRVSDYAELEPPQDGATLIHLAEEPDIAAANAQGAVYADRARGVFTALAEQAWAHIVYASSGAVYGDKADHPRREDEAVAPAHPYGEAKLAGEAIAVSAGGCAMRLGNLYGVGMPRHLVLSDIVEQLAGGETIRVRSLAPVRDFIAIEDAADGFLLAAERCLAGVYNLGTGIGTSVGALVRIVLELRGEPQREVVETAPGGAHSHIALDMTRTSAATGWRPAVALETGVARLLGGMQ